MSTFTQFHVWATGDLITAALLNGEIGSIVTAGNSIDFNNIGVNGLYASNLKPTNATQATFGGSTPYTVPGLTSSAEIDLTGTTVTSTKVAVGGDAGGTQGMLLNVPASSTNGYQLQSGGLNVLQVGAGGTAGKLNVPASTPYLFQVNGTTLGQLSATGDLQIAPLINALNTLSRVIPAYTIAGAQVASTLHAVFGTAVFSASSTVTITLTNAAIFAATNSYAVLVQQPNANAAVGSILMRVAQTSGSQFNINAVDAANSNASNNSLTIPWIAIGT